MSYTTAVIDFPWRYPSPGWLGGTNRHYDTLPLEALASFPINELLTETAHCWLWAPDFFEDAALTLLQSWKFVKRATFVWLKLSKRPMSTRAAIQAIDAGEDLVVHGGEYYRVAYGNGWYGRSSAEFLFWGTRGEENIVIESGRHVRRSFVAPLGAHSEKPLRSYEIIQGASPGSRIDVFARRPISGFDSWGREYRTVSLPVLDQWSQWAADTYQKEPPCKAGSA